MTLGAGLERPLPVVPILIANAIWLVFMVGFWWAGLASLLAGSIFSLGAPFRATARDWQTRGQ